MTTQTRTGIYETNSSSMHSLTIGVLPSEDNIPDYSGSNNTIDLGHGEYGWGYDEITGWYALADYLAIDHKHDEYFLEQLATAIKSRFPDVTVTFAEDSGYIDHESSGTTSDIPASAEAIAAFIFAPDSVIVIDNDNH